jgi:hypothetical protein
MSFGDHRLGRATRQQEDAIMGLSKSEIPSEIMDVLWRGCVIPAHPLALNADRKVDFRRQRALSRYYIDAGAGGLAVGVHTTQFAIRDHRLYEPVLGCAAEAVAHWAERPILMVAGLTGRTEQAVSEARSAVRLGYHAGLLSLAAWKDVPELEIIEHCKRLAEEIPLFGFYLLTECGGIPLSADFWRRFAEIDNVIAIKIAPFDRYGTLDVVRGVVEAGAERRIALYTGNDDHIVADLLTPFALKRGSETVTVRIRGGLLGHWAFWTRSAVEMLARIHATIESGVIDPAVLALDAKVTEANGGIYDAPHEFASCVPGVAEVLRRQGLLETTLCLNPDEVLAPGQIEEIDRVLASYPELNDDAFVAANLERWLGEDDQVLAATGTGD